MSTFVELSNDEILSIDAGGFWSKVTNAIAAIGAYDLSAACLGAITVEAPAIVTAGLVTGGLGFGVVAVVFAAAVIFR